MHDPQEPHLAAMKRVLCYLRGCLDFSLHLQRSTSYSELTVYTDADWVGCLDTRQSTSCYAVFLGDNLISWTSKRQNIVYRSSAECNTPCYGSPNLSLITVITGLVMHDTTGLFNSESSQRNHTPELDRTLGATSSPCSKFHPNSKFPRRNYIKILPNFNLETSQNFQWKSIQNLKKFLQRKLLIFLRASKLYFISKFLG
jgi:hypothetical protein